MSKIKCQKQARNQRVVTEGGGAGIRSPKKSQFLKRVQPTQFLAPL